MPRIGCSKEIYFPVVEVLESDELQETLTKLNTNSCFGINTIDAALVKLKRSIPESLEAKSFGIFWDFNKEKIAEMFSYNPVERYRELTEPDETRIDGTPFSVVLASVIKPEDEITLMTDDTHPLVDNLGAYLLTGKLTILGRTGDGIAHHAGAESRIVVKSATGDNLGFGAHEDAMIYAGSSVGKNAAENVCGPVAALGHLHG